MSDLNIEKLREKILAAQRILVLSHIRPDGDAIGSILGLGLALQAGGKQVQMVSADGVPPTFRHLEGHDQIVNRPQGDFDLICVVDCSDLNRTGEVLKNGTQPDINIDHHATNLYFARLNLVDPQAVATTEILARIIPALDLPVTRAVADALLTGLVTDTLGFRTGNMRPEALRTAASLMEKGANLPELYRLSLASRSFEATRLWAFGLSRMQCEDGLIWTSLTRADREAAGYPGRDDADLINVLSSIQDADVYIIFVEQPNEHVKVSWRSRPGIDISPIAVHFGGGGHPSASGADIAGSLEDIQQQVLSVTRQYLNTQISIENTPAK